MTRSALLTLALATLSCASNPRPVPPATAPPVEAADAAVTATADVPVSTRPAWHPAEGGPSLEQLLNVHRAFGPTVSPDGRAVAFLSDASGLPQPWSINVGDAAAPESGWRRMVEATERVQWVRFSEDGRYLLTGRDQGGDENTQIFRSNADATGLTNLTAPGVKTEFGALSHDGRLLAFTSNERSRGDFDVYVRPMGEGAPRRLADTSGMRNVVAFSRDARQVAVVEARSNFDQDLVVVDVASGAARPLTAHPGGGDIRYDSPRFTPNGRQLWVVSDKGREFMALALVSATEPVPATLTYVLAEDHDIDLLETSATGNRLAAVFNVDGFSQLRLYDSANPARLRELTRPRLPPGQVSHLSFSRDGRWLVVDLSRATSPDEIWRVNVATGAATAVTASDHAGLQDSTLVEPTVERVRSFDGLEVPMLVFRPRGLQPGAAAPSVVWVHGGPESQFTAYFSAVIQFLVGHGYVVAAPNVRGSTGYGKRYAHLDDVALREDSVRDLAAVNAWLRQQPELSPDRIGILGGSYGGYMVLAALTLQPTLWAAGCDIVGIANFRTFLERTAPYRRALREAEYGSLARDGEVLDRVSPIHRVSEIRAPLFVIHGANDPRVPVQEAEQIVAALRARQQRVEYIRFDNEGHGIFRRENKIRAYGALVAFFDEVLGR